MVEPEGAAAGAGAASFFAPVPVESCTLAGSASLPDGGGGDASGGGVAAGSAGVGDWAHKFPAHRTSPQMASTGALHFTAIGNGFTIPGLNESRIKVKRIFASIVHCRSVFPNNPRFFR